MKKSVRTALATALCLFAAHGGAFATGNVLLPDDSANSDISPAAPMSTAPQNSDTVIPGTAPLPNLIPTENQQPATNNIYMPAGTTAIPSIPMLTAPHPVTQNTPNGPVLVLPTTVYNMPADESSPAIANPAHTVTVTITNSALTASDITQISTRLGIPASKAQSLCTTSSTVMLVSTQGIVKLILAGTPKSTVGYNGNLNQVMITTQALCNKTAIPSYQGIVREINGKYLVDLNASICTVSGSTTTPSTINVTRGSFSGSCQFQ